MSTWWRRITGRSRADRELAEEIEAHIAERVDDLVDTGMSIDSARRTALREFGDPLRCVEDSREVWSISWLVSLDQDVRYALRTIRRQPGFSATVVLLLSFGIGLVTALFTVFTATFLRPWPVPDPSSVVVIEPLPPPGEQYGTLSSLEYRYFREHSGAFSQLASSRFGGGPIARPDGTVLTTVQWQFVTANYFDALRVGMAVGRGFLPEEEDYQTPRAVAIISERVWREHFRGDPGVIGSSVRVNNELMTVVGVAQGGFAGIRSDARVDLYLPLPTVAIAFDRKWTERDLRRFNDPEETPAMVFGRLRPGATAEQARSELDVLSHQFRAPLGMASPGVWLADTSPVSANWEMVRDQLGRQSLKFGVLLLIMLLACANASNLVLAKAVARRDEISIRLSLGASRWRVARQLVTEMLLLSLAAGAVGLWLAATLPQVLMHLLPGAEIRNVEQLRPDAPVFLFALLMSILACAFASIGPILQSTLAAATRRGGGRVMSRPANRILRATLLAGQIAISTVLLVSAGLLTRAVGHAMSLDPGFQVASIREMSLDLPPGAPADALPSIRESLATADLPPMAFSSLTPVTSSRPTISIRHPNEGAEKNRPITLRGVSSNYFQILGIPLLAGRSFDERGQGRELVVNQSAARLLWPDESPIGRQLVTGDENEPPQPHDIVGMVRDVSTTTLTEMEPVIYSPVIGGSVVLVRDLAPAVPERVKQLVQLTVPGASSRSRPLVEAMRGSLNNGSTLAWPVGLLALSLAMQGAFGTFALMVEERRREIGVRMAFGARGSQVVQFVVGSAARPVLAGLAAGLVLSLAIAPLLRRSLYGLSPFDPAAYLGISAILLASSLAATWVPALRATRVEPAITLRGD